MARARFGSLGVRGILAAILLSVSAASAAAEKRVALVMGNSAYQHAGSLPNPKNDATDIAAALRQLNFKVIEGVDLTRAGMEQSLRAFGDAAFDADVALLFYAGHGVEINGVNYLIPVDAKLSTEQDAAFETVPMDLVLRVTEPARRLRIIILDACRNNPMAAQMKRLDNKRSVTGGGLAAIEPVADTLVAYATKAGRTASDGFGRNSPFSEAMLKIIREPGLEIGLMFRKIRDQVLRSTDRVQEPFVYGSLGGEPFYLTPAPAAAPESSEEVALWKRIKDGADKAAFEDYLARFPQGLFFDLATLRLQGLAGPKTAAAPAPAASTRTLAERKAGEVFRDCEDCPQLVALPTDPGSPAASGLAVGRFEVSRLEYSRFIKEAGHQPAPGCFVYSGGRFQGRVEAGWRNPGFTQVDLDPAVCISHEDARAYVAWLAKKTGKPYRLLSDREWEFAARAGATDNPWAGQDAQQCRFENGADAVAQTQYTRWKTAACEDGFVHTSPVGRFAPNAFGLYDMLGNAAEWVDGCYTENGSADCDYRVMRGGSWYSPPSLLKASYRDRNFSTNRGSITGFRVARND